MKKNSYAVIMNGGIGSRLWPLSRVEQNTQKNLLMFWVLEKH